MPQKPGAGGGGRIHNVRGDETSVPLPERIDDRHHGERVWARHKLGEALVKTTNMNTLVFLFDGRSYLATYDPPQPLWKRNIAGILDFLLAVFVFGFFLNEIFGHQPHPPVINANVATTEMFGLDGWPALICIVLVVLYFVALGRSGGTVFQRLFGMKRAKSVDKP
jgi:hypothetical protein